MSNKFEVGKTYVVLKDFHIHRKGDEFTVERLATKGDVCDSRGHCVAHYSRLTEGFVKLKEENNVSNTITQLEQQALEMQKKLDEMKATIEQQKQAEENSKKKENVFGLGGIEMNDDYHYITYANGNKLKANSSLRAGTSNTEYTTTFNNKSKAEAIAEAFNVLLELRACEGVVSAEEKIPQYYIEFYKDGAIGTDAYNKVSGSLSPFFESKKAAQDALNKVGEERVRKAFLAMQGTFN